MSPEEIAWQMMKSRDFQNTKCEHGSPDDAPVFSVPIPRLDSSYVNMSVGIEQGEMSFTRYVEAILPLHIEITTDTWIEKTCKNYSTSRFKSWYR